MSVPSSELASHVMGALTPPDLKLIYTSFSSYEYECFRREKLRHVEVPNSKQCKLFEYDLLPLDTIYRWKEVLA